MSGGLGPSTVSTRSRGSSILLSPQKPRERVQGLPVDKVRHCKRSAPAGSPGQRARQELSQELLGLKCGPWGSGHAHFSLWCGLQSWQRRLLSCDRQEDRCAQMNQQGHMTVTQIKTISHNSAVFFIGENTPLKNVFIAQ